MSGIFFKLGRGLGYASVPAIQKSKQIWQAVTGKDSDSVRAEAEFGQAMAAELRLKVGISADQPDLDLIREIVRRLGGCVRDKRRTFHVEILRHRAPAATALPGGFIFVNTALLEFCHRDPDELAFITGHEMGHILRGHALERMLRRIGAEGLSAILSRGLLNPVLREAGLKWLEVSHSHEAELEADEFASRVMLAAGYDGQAAVRLLQRLAELRSAGLSEYFRSHPPEAERIAQVESILRKPTGRKAA